MTRSEKKRADRPNAQDYRRLIGTVDMLLESFRQVKASAKQKWLWWSTTCPAGVEYRHIEDRVLSGQADRVEAGFEQDTTRCWSGTPSGPNGDEYTWYFASTDVIDRAEFFAVMQAVESAVKALTVRFPPGERTEFLTYLDSFSTWSSIYAASAVARNNYHCHWFEFLWAAAEMVNSPILHGERIADFDDVPGVEIRGIRQDICEASILALQLLREKAEERLRLLEEAKQPAAVDSGGLTCANEKAYRSYEWAAEQDPTLKTDRQVHDWLTEHGFEGYELPSFETWARQVRAGRGAYGTQKNHPRAGRTGRSIVKHDEI